MESGIPHGGSILTTNDNNMVKIFGNNNPPGTRTQKYIVYPLNDTQIPFFYFISFDNKRRQSSIEQNFGFLSPPPTGFTC